MRLNIQLFASLNVGDTYETTPVGIKPYGSQYTSNAYQMKFSVKLNSQSLENFTSNITITSYMRTLGNDWGWSGFTRIYMERYTKANEEINYSLKGESTQLKSLPVNNAYNWVNCGSWSGNIQHKTDGTCTLYVKNHLLTSTSSSYRYIPKDTEQVSELLTLNQLHKPPSNVSYTITETNSLLTSAGISNNLFVENLSIKQINVTGDLHDSATVDRVGVYNRITAYSSTANPLTLNLKNITLQKNDAGTKIPLVGYIKDSFTTQGLSSSLDNPDLYDFITYRNIGITEPQTFAKRYGQLSGQVKLTISGTYFNGTIGNKNQSGSYKPTIKYKFWKLGDSEPSSFTNTVDPANITISNGTFTVSGLNIGSTTASASNYFNPSYSYRLKIQVNDNFTTYTSVEKVITKGEPVWSEYKDRVEFKKINVKTDIVNPNLDLFSDTSGSSWKDMMKNKLDYCVSTMKTSKQNMETFINGGWSGVNYGFGIFSKIGTAYQLTWFTNDGYKYVRKIGSTYSYYSSTPDVLYNNNTGIQSKSYASVNNLSNYKKLAITFTVYKNSDQANTGGTAHICWLDLSKKDANGYARAGIVVPYSDSHLSSGNIQPNDFKALFEADFNNNRVYCLFAYNNAIQTSSGYVMTKIEGYYN